LPDVREVLACGQVERPDLLAALPQEEVQGKPCDGRGGGRCRGEEEEEEAPALARYHHVAREHTASQIIWRPDKRDAPTKRSALEFTRLPRNVAEVFADA
jgi:hypothetical protein